MYYVYMIKNAGNSLYIGITENIQNRVRYHNTKLGSQFTKNRATFRVVFKEEYGTLTEARKREIQIKKWRREKKEMLIQRYAYSLSTKA